MNKAFKITVISLAFLLMALSISLYFFIKLMDPNDYKQNLSHMIEKSTGYRVEFEGPVSFNVLPHITLELNNVRLKNPQSFGKGNALTLKRVILGLNLTNLLRKQISVNHLSISGGTLHAIKNPSGIWNLMTAQGIKEIHTHSPPSSDQKLETPPLPPSIAHKKTKGSELSIDIRQLLIQDFNLIIEDQLIHQTRMVKKIRFNAPNIQMNLPAADNPSPLIYLLKSLYVHADLAIETIQSGNFILKNLFFACNADNGKIRLSPFTYTLLQGKGNGQLYLNVQNDPILQLEQHIVQARAEAAQNEFPLASGMINFGIKLNARSKVLSTLTHHLNGDVIVRVDNGALNHLNLLYELTKLEEILTYHKSRSHRPPKNITLFKYFENSYHFTDSVSEQSTLTLQANQFHVAGSGKIWLIKDAKFNPQLDYNLSIFPDPKKFPKVFDILEKEDIKSATGGGLPLELVGSMSHPKYTIDPQTLKKILVGKTANALLNLLPDGTREKLNNKLLTKLRRYNQKMNQ